MMQVRVKKLRGRFALDAEFRAPSPGVVALFGRSGCGKSTLVDLIAGLIRPDEGLIRVGEDVLFDSARGIDVPAERRRIGYVFQDARLFPHLDVEGNLRYGERRIPAAEASGMRAARRVPFHEITELLGLTALISRRPHQLSGGERQRVALGRALLAAPRLLLLDEPLASLDLARREELLPYLEKLRDRYRVPMIYVSHEYEEVLRLASHVVVMRDGAVTSQGNVADVSLSPELRSIVGVDGIGAVLEGEVTENAALSGLARVRVGAGVLHVQADGLATGQRVRVQLLARDLILAVEPPQGLSVRNSLEGMLVRIAPDEPRTQLVEIDIGGATVMAQVTDQAATELHLAPGRRVWVLVKSVSLRGHLYPAAAAPAGASVPGSAAVQAQYAG